jgi:hypothetical protein
MENEYLTPEERREIRLADRIVMAVLLLLFLLICCTGCTHRVYVPVETVKYDSIYLSKIQKDSIYLKEYVNVYQKADTVYKETIVTKYKEKLTTDTLYINKVDTIRTVVEVEKPLTKSQRTLMNFGWGFIGMWALVLLLIVFRLIYKRK